MYKITTLFVLLIISVTVFGQKQADKLFPKEKMMELSVYYYPEAWDKSQWERDIKNISSMGFEFIHLTDHAWYFLEPQEGKYNFGWVDTCINLAAKYGMKTLLSTPTSAPPVWLNENYPECLMVSEDGVIQRHGSRQQYSWSSDKFRTFTDKICTAMGRHFGKNPNIIGWQIDNEPSHYGKFDYSENARKKFIVWLTNKYETVDKLNNSWGMQFWSMMYQNFEQVRLPNQKELVQQANPHAVMDFKRFTADECASFLSSQNTILKKYILPNQWTTTDFMFYNQNNNPQLDKDLDLVGFNMYLVTGYDFFKSSGSQSFRIGSPYQISFGSDFFRPITGLTGCMELQPGQVNWGSNNYQPYPGAIRMWWWHCFAGGSKYVSSYRYRQPRYGMEQYHSGMVGLDGVTPSPGGKEFMQFSKELNQVRQLVDFSEKPPKEYLAKKVGFMWNLDNIWNTDLLKQNQSWDGYEHLKKYYQIFKQYGAPVDIIDETKDFSQYPFLVAPAYQLLDSNLIARWQKYVNDGGNLILTVRSGQKDRNGYFWEKPLSQPLYKLIGSEVSFFDVLSDSHKGKIDFNNKQYDWQMWGDVLNPYKGTEVLATYADQFYKGKPCVVFHKMGKGSVTYIGIDAKGDELEAEIIKTVFSKVNVGIEKLPEGLAMEWRDGFWLAMNYASNEVEVPSGINAKFIVGQKKLKTCDVAIWTDKK